MDSDSEFIVLALVDSASSRSMSVVPVLSTLRLGIVTTTEWLRRAYRQRQRKGNDKSPMTDQRTVFRYVLSK